MTAQRAQPSLSRRAALAGLGAGAIVTTLHLGGHAAARDATPEPKPTVAPAKFKQENDVVYGEVSGEPLLLDVYRPLGWEAPRPAVVVFHGGGLVYGDRSDVFVPAAELAIAGYVAFAVGYRLFDPNTSANPWPAQLDDVQRAVRWVRAHADAYGVDPDRVGAYGHSSGGTLAVAVGVRETRDDSDPDLAGISSRVACVVDLSGDVDLTIPYPDPMWTEINATMLGGTPEEKPAAYLDASPLYQVDEKSVPFLLLHGALDHETPVEHSRRLFDALRKAGVEVTYGEYPRAGHLEIAPWDVNGPWTIAFFGRHLHPER